jgi:hypothetical protein
MELVILKLSNVLTAHVSVCPPLFFPSFECSQEYIAILFLLLTLSVLQIIFKASLINIASVEQPVNSIGLAVFNIALINGSVFHHELTSTKRHSQDESPNIHASLWEIKDSNSMRQGILSHHRFTFHYPV